MRPLRLILLLFCFVACPVIFTFLTLLNAHPRHLISTSSVPLKRKSGFSALFSFHTPSTLFPPSAIISLTDDNSTFFLARPAAFGPLLPSKGLSGQLWVGSGFGDDSLRRGGTAVGAEGELGCSDVPGWGDDNTHRHNGDHRTGVSPKRKSTSHSPDGPVKAIHEVGNLKGSARTKGGHTTNEEDQKPSTTPLEDDGTDDYLHHPLPGSEVFKLSRTGQRTQHEVSKGKRKLMAHADIQSLQEGAEITGKVVLLSRGGCGFLEKVKWAQRRGGVALIVGDDTRGGGLVTMYARGDTSNVTIPSLFTSHTTAHLLSSLIPSGNLVDDLSPEESAKLGQDEDRSVKGVSKKKGTRKGKGIGDGPTFTHTMAKHTPTSTPRPTIVPASPRVATSVDSDSQTRSQTSVGWLRSIFYMVGIGSRSPQSRLPEDSRRPPSSGHLDWVLIEDWTEDEPSSLLDKSGVEKEGHGVSRGTKLRTVQHSSAQQDTGDDFVIGVQDWRDPDLLGTQNAGSSSKSSTTKAKGTSNASAHKVTSSLAMKAASKSSEPLRKPMHNGDEALEGGSITPGSGEYGNPEKQRSNYGKSSKPGSADSTTTEGGSIHSEENSKGWFWHLPWVGDDDNSAEAVYSQHGKQALHTVAESNRVADHVVEDLSDVDGDLDDLEEHEGLWVTLTPTSMSTSPFFDTLLVLVVSPLVTLTVVYALLLIRSRIRRRRWRAPKSLVDRLPVRTYHTTTCSSNSTPSQLVSPSTSSPTTPLLPSSPQSVSPRPRPRSRTTSGVGVGVTASLNKATVKASLLQHEKLGEPSQWKRRYTGKQVECVVCLEEYVDGQSRVMSLPCGHEFHVECITPWLTTRRRTCPICKGDVVRSMTEGTPSTAPQPPYRDDPGEDIQALVAGSTNESPSSAIPIPHNPAEDDADLERGDDMAATLVNDGPSTSRGGWRGLTSMSLSAFSGEAAWRQAQADRSR
ncbi:MAG: hypothetical protein M1830_003632 [Pleopsidium flavum]|nr:MAG: hypothetical protein M1830_003632 [Pleopsidium flavum]